MENSSHNPKNCILNEEHINTFKENKATLVINNNAQWDFFPSKQSTKKKKEELEPVHLS